MAKLLEVNDNTPQDQQRQARQHSDHDRNRQKLEGKALQVNQNSIEDGKSAQSPASPRRGSRDTGDPQKLQGKSLQVNENSVEDEDNETVCLSRSTRRKNSFAACVRDEGKTFSQVHWFPHKRLRAITVFSRPRLVYATRWRRCRNSDRQTSVGG